jgi:hypothetical protein
VNDYTALCEESQRNFGALADCQVIRMNARISELFETEKDFLVLLRPDNHIALITSEISLAAVQEYFNKQHFQKV